MIQADYPHWPADPSRPRQPEIELAAPDEMDIRLIAANMREADRREVAYTQAVPPELAVRRSLRLSYSALCGRVDGVPACIFGLGIGVAAARIARPWLLGTDLVERFSREFLARNQDVIEGWLLDWEVLENWVADDNRASRVWLRWLGFRFDAPAPFGPFGHPFRRFHLTRASYFRRALPQGDEPCA